MLRRTMKFMPSEEGAAFGPSRSRSCEMEQMPLLPGIPQTVLNPYNCQIEYIGLPISIMLY
ncbi:hypothetical protein YA62_008365 [Agrobacterium sp. LC34]|uniref:Uncharacterized protein n=1 Tax=Agrobacterium tumefaciens TaxID=358 RepID=A0AAE6EKL9_AGRTU|nr:hypothetical protein AKG12_06025 [Agrobacterium sp. SUL3]QCL89584.1 hypothetical protein CFBP6623_10780 [Agrobacterium tumefaciens]QCM00529.1 hypothetical protein CFBP6624_10505 [Agrobacterium tumefaciens]TKT66628.1 hypothetical protein YA62_008365 [Agrobacterium sp. LC34]